MPGYMLAGQAPVSSHLSPTPLVATYKNHSHKRPALVIQTFFVSRGCPLTRASTVLTKACIAFLFPFANSDIVSSEMNLISDN